MISKDVKRALKRYYKKVNFSRDNRREMHDLINFFVKTADGDCGKDFYIFKGTNVKEILKQLDNYITIEGVNFTSPYDCTGRYFSDKIKIKVLKAANRTLITQKWAYDV